nr:hypothetical protein CFP56_07442 [Quercus suber]
MQPRRLRLLRVHAGAQHEHVQQRRRARQRRAPRQRRELRQHDQPAELPGPGCGGGGGGGGAGGKGLGSSCRLAVKNVAGRWLRFILKVCSTLGAGAGAGLADHTRLREAQLR